MLEKFIVAQHKDARDMFYIGDDLTIAKIIVEMYDKYVNSDLFINMSIRKASTSDAIEHARMNFKNKNTGVAIAYYTLAAHNTLIQHSFIAGTKDFTEKYIHEFENAIGKNNTTIITKKQNRLYIAKCAENVHNCNNC